MGLAGPGLWDDRKNSNVLLDNDNLSDLQTQAMGQVFQGIKHSLTSSLGPQGQGQLQP